MALRFRMCRSSTQPPPSATGRLCSDSFTRLWLSIYEDAFCPELDGNAAATPTGRVLYGARWYALRVCLRFKLRRLGNTRWLFGATIILLPLAVLAFHFAFWFSPLLLFGLLCAGAAGSRVSVMAKVPALDVSLSAELDSYRRRIFTRIGIGVVASLIGCAFLGWFPISIQNQTFADALTTLPGTCRTNRLALGRRAPTG